MIVDCHVTIGCHFTGEESVLTSYIEEMDRYGIDCALLCPKKTTSYSIPDANSQIEKIPSKIGSHCFYKALRLDPWHKETSHRVIENSFNNKKFIAAYLHPWEDNFRCNDSRVFYLYELLEQKSIPVVIETGYPWVSHITQLWEVSILYPNLRILATNAGQLDLSGLTLGNVSAVLKERKNIYLGTSAAVAADWLKEAAENWARGRVLFTSSYPMFEPEMEKFRIDHGHMSQKAKEEIYRESAKSFLALDFA